MLASSISEDIADRGKKKASNSFKSPPKHKSLQPKHRKPKVEIVKKPAPAIETAAPSKTVPIAGQPGWVYVPVSWVKKDVSFPSRIAKPVLGLGS
ncbi:Hypothetical protein NTJ_11173 [Nesidiocoris tenuis]|uniref:Uncharacterized protein n=1 Tax=Nesidiocoris tenuis TaxID=355587 RepID=A0ABN7B2A1_9HEMI|nr:Hypothetical protein NTJ_11173 [Nesidiocoris tenuis]